MLNRLLTVMAFCSLFCQTYSILLRTDSCQFSIQSFVFRSSTAVCAAFLENKNKLSYARVAFNGLHYDLPPWSISILPDCKTTVFNTARVRLGIELLVHATTLFFLTLIEILAEIVYLSFSWSIYSISIVLLHHINIFEKHVLKDMLIQVRSQISQMKMEWAGGFTWQSYNEEINSLGEESFTTVGLLEQINVTRDSTDYLWYTT